MSELTLVRYCYGPTETLGEMQVGDAKLVTIERPWIPDAEHGSRPNESCVPDGAYTLVPHSSGRYPNTWALVNPDLKVTHYPERAGRYAILFHAANTVDQIEGCIAPGTNTGRVDRKTAVLGSRSAMETLRRHLKRGEHRLIIRPTAGAPLA